MFTIRKCIEEMREVCSSDIYLYTTRTRIHVYEINPDKYDHISTYKERGGNKILRKIFCYIESSNKTLGMRDLEKFRLFEPKIDFNYFGENDYLIPERDMNIFISLNGGIDHYRTIGQHVYMMMDTMYLFCN